jgi:L-ribulose-5-phosphate 4-epimerase
MTEDVARTVHLARAYGEPIPIPQADIDALYDRYTHVYGQHAQSAATAAEENGAHER